MVNKDGKELTEYEVWFARNLDNILHEKKVTNKEFARSIGMCESSISQWRNGKLFPSSKAILILADALKIKASLLTDMPKKETPELEKILAKISIRDSATDLEFLRKYVELNDSQRKRAIKMLELL